MFGCFLAEHRAGAGHGCGLPVGFARQQPAPWPASATHGAPAYPLRDRTGIQAESFARNPYHAPSRPVRTACAVVDPLAFALMPACCSRSTVVYAVQHSIRKVRHLGQPLETSQPDAM